MDTTESVTDLLGKIRSAQRDLVNYKEQVRDTFITFANENDIDDDTANEFLESLGLEGLETEFPVKVSFTYTAEISVMARSADKAYEIAEDALYDMAPNSIRLFSEKINGLRDDAHLENYETLEY